MDQTQQRIDLNVLREAMQYCQLKQIELLDAVPSPRVEVAGIAHGFVFHPDRLLERKNVIDDMLDLMPIPFHHDSGGGWSFLNACVDRNDREWGQHLDMEALFCLGMAIGRVNLLLERNLWHALPAGMPYFMVGPRN